jgi:hypothetical protein
MAHSNKSIRPLFQYEPLDLETDTHRFLQILPGLDEDDISCEITVLDMHNTYLDGKRRFHYNALSYEWGDPNQPNHWIRVNDGYLQVRHNLFDFLHRARANLKLHSDFRSTYLD